MTINGNHMGGQFPSPPPTFRDHVIFWSGLVTFLAVICGGIWWGFR